MDLQKILILILNKNWKKIPIFKSTLSASVRMTPPPTPQFCCLSVDITPGVGVPYHSIASYSNSLSEQKLTAPNQRSFHIPYCLTMHLSNVIHNPSSFHQNPHTQNSTQFQLTHIIQPKASWYVPHTHWHLAESRCYIQRLEKETICYTYPDLKNKM